MNLHSRRRSYKYIHRAHRFTREKLFIQVLLPKQRPYAAVRSQTRHRNRRTVNILTSTTTSERLAYLTSILRLKATAGKMTAKVTPYQEVFTPFNARKTGSSSTDSTARLRPPGPNPLRPHHILQIALRCPEFKSTRYWGCVEE